MKDFQLDFPCVSFKEKGETAESERPGERVNWKVWFEMSGTFPLAFFADLLQKKRVAARSERSVYIARRAKCTERERLQDSLFRRRKTLALRRIDSWKSDFAKSSPRWEQVVFVSVKIIETHVVRSRFRRTYAGDLSWIFCSELWALAPPLSWLGEARRFLFFSTSSFLCFENWDQEVALPGPVVFFPSSLGNQQKRKRIASDKLTFAKPPAKLRNLEKRRARARATFWIFGTHPLQKMSTGNA